MTYKIANYPSGRAIWFKAEGDKPSFCINMRDAPDHIVVLIEQLYRDCENYGDARLATVLALNTALETEDMYTKQPNPAPAELLYELPNDIWVKLSHVVGVEVSRTVPPRVYVRLDKNICRSMPFDGEEEARSWAREFVAKVNATLRVAVPETQESAAHLVSDVDV